MENRKPSNCWDNISLISKFATLIFYCTYHMYLMFYVHKSVKVANAHHTDISETNSFLVYQLKEKTSATEAKRMYIKNNLNERRMEEVAEE